MEVRLAAAASGHELTFDVAADCRTGVFGPNSRGATNVISGKIFPAGVLPSGLAGNDPILSVNGVEPIGDWHHRSQTFLPFPADVPPFVAEAYGSAPILATFYFLFNDGSALVTENWGILDLDGVPTVLGAITGGFGRFGGAAGDFHSELIGSNATGCPNARNRFKFVPGSLRSTHEPM